MKVARYSRVPGLKVIPSVVVSKPSKRCNKRFSNLTI
jgi:hypothetical protein